MRIGQKIETIYGILTVKGKRFSPVLNQVIWWGTVGNVKYDITPEILIEEEEEVEEIKIAKGEKGEPGRTPIKGVDYYSKEQVSQMVSELVEKAKPRKGVDYYTDEEILAVIKKITPIKGKDYYDGKDGKTPVCGKDYFTQKQIEGFISSAVKEARKLIKDGEPGKDGKDGFTPEHKWIGTRLMFKKKDGTWGKGVDLKGVAGRRLGGGGISTIKSASDVNIKDPVNSQGIVYNSETKKWENGTIDTTPIIGDDEIKDTMIDWGTGVGQVSTDDITEGAAKFVTATDITNLGNLSGENSGDQDLSVLVPKSSFTTDGGILVATGAGTFAEETGAALRTSIGCDPIGTDNSTDVTIGTANGLSIDGQELSLGLADTDNNGALSSTDWDTFNNKVSSQWTTSGSDIYYNSGNVGIGTDSPGAKLEISVNNDVPNISIFRNDTTILNGDVLGGILFNSNDANITVNQFTSAKIEAIAEVNHTAGQANTGLRFFTTTGSEINERVRINNTGNVGIGTTNPLSKLHINGGTGTLSTGLTFGDGDTGWYEASDDNFRLQTLGADRMTIDSSGNVGIGTDSPSEKLNVVGGFIDTDAGFKITKTGTGDYVRGLQIVRDGVNDGYFGSLTKTGGTSGYMFIDYSASNYLTPNFAISRTTGNVGIGTTGPDRKLDILDASNPQIRLTHTDGSFYTDLQTTASGHLYINPSGGNVGIGTTAPLSKLHINGGTGSLATGLSFGDGDTGIYENSDDTLYYQHRTGTPFYTTGTGLYSLLQTPGFGLINEAATATNPVFVMNNDTNTGIGSGGFDILSLIAGGVNGINIVETGSVAKIGIGTLTADKKVEILDATGAQLRLTHTDGSLYTDLQTDSNGDLTITPNGGNVGIATDSPTAKLDVNGNVYINSDIGGAYDLAVGGDTSRANIAFESGIADADGADIFSIVGYASNAITEAEKRTFILENELEGSTANNRGSKLTFKTKTDGGGMQNVLILDNEGNVGIGTTTPATKLEVSGAITQSELSADPADPAEGSSVTWQSDGTGAGDDGDIMIKITAGGTTKTTTLVDFSTL